MILQGGFELGNIFNTRPETVHESWIKDIKKKNLNKTEPINIMIPAKLIVFAWSYSTYQTHELKSRYGNINFVTCLEQVFMNKLAEIALALYFGYHDGDILDGNSFVRLDPSSSDERYVSTLQLYSGNKPISVSGAKKFLYPTIDKYPAFGQCFVYIDAARYRCGNEVLSRINIQNNSIKATIIGFASKTDLKANQEQNLLLEYSNKHSAFTGFELLKNVNLLIHNHKRYSVPKYVEELQCCDLDEKLNTIITYIKNNTDSKPISYIDYASLFDPIIR